MVNYEYEYNIIDDSDNDNEEEEEEEEEKPILDVSDKINNNSKDSVFEELKYSKMKIDNSKVIKEEENSNLFKNNNMTKESTNGIANRLENLVQRLNAYNINQVPNYTVVVQYLQTNNYERSIDEVVDYIRQRQWFESCTNYSTTGGRNWKTFGYVSSKPYFGLKARQAFAIKEWLLANQENGLNINDFRFFRNSPPPSLHESVQKIIIDLSKPTNQHHVDYNNNFHLKRQIEHNNILTQRQSQPRSLEKLDNLQQQQQRTNVEQHNQWLQHIHLLLRKRQLQRDDGGAIDNS
ncbi:unnamed protein product [Cunninghamella echinulata]